VYVYTPNSLVDGAPIFVYFHGGGMVIGCRENVETTCQIISAYDLHSLSQFDEFAHNTLSKLFNVHM